MRVNILNATSMLIDSDASKTYLSPISVLFLKLLYFPAEESSVGILPLLQVQLDDGFLQCIACLVPLLAHPFFEGVPHYYSFLDGMWSSG